MRFRLPFDFFVVEPSVAERRIVAHPMLVCPPSFAPNSPHFFFHCSAFAPLGEFNFHGPAGCVHDILCFCIRDFLSGPRKPLVFGRRLFCDLSLLLVPALLTIIRRSLPVLRSFAYAPRALALGSVGIELFFFPLLTFFSRFFSRFPPLPSHYDWWSRQPAERPSYLASRLPQ